MALPCSSILNLVLISCLLFCITTSDAQSSFKPKALVLPVTKHQTTLQYIAIINQRTPFIPLNLTLDLGGRYFWVDCEHRYVSSSYKPARCGSAECSLANSKSCTTECYSTPKPGCNNNTCGLFPDNPLTQAASSGDLGQDIVAIQSTDGSNPGEVAKVPNFLFSCAATYLLEGLANGVRGMAGLGRTKVSFPSQFSAALKFDRKFAICLSSFKNSRGVVFFGDGPYVLMPKIDVSKSLISTPLILNKVSIYSINGDFTVPVNSTLLKINKEGYGGTKISTVQPYTVLDTSIHKALTTAFARQLSKVPRVAAVAPFDLCFDSTGIGSTRVGPAVPRIDLVLQSSNVIWSIFGANSMVEVKKDVLCLGFVDGGANPRTSIVIGGHQLEDNLLQFDVANSRLGFSSSLLSRQTNCANFNFTPVFNNEMGGYAM
ncbi:Probable aspartic proteinase GIP2 [Linum grandiflorum]